MENSKIQIDIEYLGKILKDRSLNKEDTQSILLDLIDHNNLTNPITIQKSLGEKMFLIFFRILKKETNLLKIFILQ